MIEELGATVSEFNRQELSGILLNTLNQWEKSKKTPDAKITLLWKGSQPPFVFEKGGSLVLGYSLSVDGVKVVKNVEVWFFVQSGFKFKDVESWTQGADRGDIANYMTAKTKFDRLQKGTVNFGNFTVISENEPGTYKGFYGIYSDEYVTEERHEFDMVVK